MPADIKALNEQYGITEQVVFVAGPGGMPFIEVRNRHAAASISLHGGHVVRYQPRDGAPILWVSERAEYAAGKSIRGGIPVCWPWFGANAADPSKPMHGFVRKLMWSARGSAAHGDGATEVRLGIADDPETRALWPYGFDLELVVTVGPQLVVELITHNSNDVPFTITGALHTYFAVGDITTTSIAGLEDTDYLDKTTGFERKTQRGPVTFHAETDRVYVDTTATCVINDASAHRRIAVEKAGSRTTVVWNPWAEKAANIADMQPDDYLRMVCVETANAANDEITVAANGTHRLRLVVGAGSDSPSTIIHPV